VIQYAVRPRGHPPRPDGHAQFGTITAADAAALAAMGSHHNVPGQVFTVDGNAERFPSESDHFPDVQTNVVPVHLSMGAYNCLQQADCHAYWEFNYTTNWVHPLYELPFTGGFPDKIGAPPDALQDGEIGALQSIVPGPGPAGKPNKPQVYGDNPNRPRDPDLFDADIEAQREFRQRFIPSGLANEILLDVYARPVSFEPRTRNLTHRLFKAYAAAAARRGMHRNEAISSSEGDIDTATDGFPDHSRVFLPPPVYNRFAGRR